MVGRARHATPPAGAVWLPPGSRLETVFDTADSTIAALSQFICEVAQHVGDGSSLSTAVRSAAKRHPQAVGAFDLADRDDASIDENFSLIDRFTFPNETLPASLIFERGSVKMRLALDGLSALDVKAMLSMCGSAHFTPDEIRDVLDEPITVFFDALLEHGILATGRPPAASTPFADVPGVTRLQHAGLLYRGREAGVLVDPHLHSTYEPGGLRETFQRHWFEGHVDAILISHSHLDHFHLPTLMSFPRDLPIVVPRSPRATMLCPDFGATLRALGFERVITLGWYDPPLSIGDLEIFAFPFYGEQPLLHEPPRHPELRNHGNTYVVRHETYTSWCLIDSGNDRAGRMADVARDVAAQFGGVDLLISNLREFSPYTPLYITGAGHYWLALTPDQMRRFSLMRDDVITLGPGGLAEVCKLVGAREFLPYAHWWGEPGALSGADESSLLEQLATRLVAGGVATVIRPWRIGESRLTDRRPTPEGTPSIDAAIAEQQRRLLDYARTETSGMELGEAIARALVAVPRHRFVQRYRPWGTKVWHDVNAGNLSEHLAALYADRPLCLLGEDDDDPISTISQPTFVLRMLHLLELSPGQKVFELGSGSGWNAALMGHLVAPGGCVHSVEVVPELAEAAARNVTAVGLENVSIVAGDGGDGCAGSAPFDRAVFTAGTYDLPRQFYGQVRDGGRLLMVVKSEGGGDTLYVLGKNGDHFESLAAVPCGFVSLKGKYQLKGLDPSSVEALPAWARLRDREINRVPFWWGGAGSDTFVWRTQGIRCFLSIADPSFRAFSTPRSISGIVGDHYFGLWDEAEESLVLAKDDALIAYGTPHAMERLRGRIAEWTLLGMPGGASYTLRLYPSDHPVRASANQWIVKRNESQFVWTLGAS
jgi:protein-L-isoaspartate(D-aspartate) O-methyltransferase